MVNTDRLGARPTTTTVSHGEPSSLAIPLPLEVWPSSPATLLLIGYRCHVHDPHSFHKVNQGLALLDVVIHVAQSTITAPMSAANGGVYWFIIRGVEGMPVVMGDIQLPPTALLKTYRFTSNVKKYELVDLVDVPSTKSGAVLGMKFDATGGVC